MKRTKISIFIISFLLVLANGCTLQSLFPLYTEKDVIYNENVLGVWDMGEDETWEFVQKTNKKDSIKGLPPYYQLIVIEKGEEVILDVHLLRLGKYNYFNFYLTDFDSENSMAHFNLFPVNTFARTVIHKDSLNIEFFNPDFIATLIEEKKVRIKHVFTDDDERLLITAPTNEIQRFVIKYEDEKDLVFDDDDMIYRLKS